jgi:hypothetical protein
MQASVTWRMVVLGGALLWGACSKEPAPAKDAPAAQAEQAPKPAEQPAAAPEAEAEAPSKESQAAAPAEDEDATPRELKVGQSRDEVMKLFGTCAERKAFIPPGPKSFYVEVFQPKNTEACKKRLGERQFTIRGGQLFQITPGLIPPPPPSTGTAENI